MLEKVIEILSDYTEIEGIKIEEQSDLKADLGLNSLDLIELVTAFEDAFQIQIPDRKIAKIQTVEDILKIIEE